MEPENLVIIFSCQACMENWNMPLYLAGNELIRSNRQKQKLILFSFLLNFSDYLSPPSPSSLLYTFISSQVILLSSGVIAIRPIANTVLCRRSVMGSGQLANRTIPLDTTRQNATCDLLITKLLGGTVSKPLSHEKPFQMKFHI